MVKLRPLQRHREPRYRRIHRGLESPSPSRVRGAEIRLAQAQSAGVINGVLERFIGERKALLRTCRGGQKKWNYGLEKLHL